MSERAIQFDDDLSPAGARAGVRGRKGNPALLQRRLRDIHLWLAMLAAPSLIFFSATGAVQLFDWHHPDAATGFTPPAVIEKLGMVHKKQRWALGKRPAPGAPGAGGLGTGGPGASGSVAGGAATARSPAAPKPPTAAKTLALKWLFLFVALFLLVTTSLGVWIGLGFGRQRRLALGLLVAGAVLPVLLLLI